MAGAIRVRERPPEALGFPSPPQTPLRAQLLPCRVGHDGPAAVSAFLRPKFEPGSDGGELWASFRGRLMGGRDIPLPPGYRGVLLQENDPPASDEGDPQERWVTVTGTFDVITEWGIDAVPPQAGGLALAMQWGSLAPAV
ncbi:RNH2C Ribonuclease, partial [Rhinopomastus cyanomelas]|nr:RNH2C Ribonuclease [Rhinopomastus cyanomelas]